MKTRVRWSAAILAAAGWLMADEVSPALPEVPYPEGYRRWMHVASAVTPPRRGVAGSHPEEEKVAAPHGLIHHIYANEKALEGLRTGSFPEGAIFTADWFVLEEKSGGLVQGPRKSLNVMVKAARYAATGGWGYEDFDQDSPVIRNVGRNAVKQCMDCHAKARGHDYVFSTRVP
jgi:hypothetical protein